MKKLNYKYFKGIHQGWYLFLEFFILALYGLVLFLFVYNVEIYQGINHVYFDFAILFVMSFAIGTTYFVDRRVLDYFDYLEVADNDDFYCLGSKIIRIKDEGITLFKIHEMETIIELKKEDIIFVGTKRVKAPTFMMFNRSMTTLKVKIIEEDSTEHILYIFVLLKKRRSVEEALYNYIAK